jgi:hypothetical protein
MYAFGVLAWEVLSEQIPFSEVTAAVMLPSLIFQGARPPLTSLPLECPLQVTELITACWSEHRSERKSASECWAILQHVHRELTSNSIGVAYDSSDFEVADAVLHRLDRRGLQAERIPNGDTDSTKRYRTVLVLVSEKSQSNTDYVASLRCLRDRMGAGNFLAVMTDSFSSQELDPDISYVCQLLRSDSRRLFDLSGALSEVTFPLESSKENVVQLYAAIDAMCEYVSLGGPDIGTPRCH